MKAKSVFALFLTLWLAVTTISAPLLQTVEQAQSSVQKAEDDSHKVSLLPAHYIAHTPAHLSICPSFDFLDAVLPAPIIQTVASKPCTATHCKILLGKLLSSDILINAP